MLDLKALLSKILNMSLYDTIFTPILNGGGVGYVRFKGFVGKNIKCICHQIKWKLALCHTWTMVYRWICVYRLFNHRNCGWQRVSKCYKQPNYTSCHVNKQRILKCNNINNKLRSMVVYGKPWQCSFLQGDERDIKVIGTIQHNRNNNRHHLTLDWGCLAC